MCVLLAVPAHRRGLSIFKLPWLVCVVQPGTLWGRLLLACQCGCCCPLPAETHTWVLSVCPTLKHSKDCLEHV